jgi:hypothetical protein
MPGRVTSIEGTLPAKGAPFLVQLKVAPLLFKSLAVSVDASPDVLHAKLLMDMSGLALTLTVSVAVALLLKFPNVAIAVTILV